MTEQQAAVVIGLLRRILWVMLNREGVMPEEWNP